jgi:hypothetical protein
MSMNPTKRWLGAWALVFCLTPVAMAQTFQPFAPVPMENEDIGPFSPAEVSEYGGGPAPNQGFFFTFEGLAWNVTPPDTATVGRSDITPIVTEPTNLFGETRIETSNLDTTDVRSIWHGGNRVEFGYLEADLGWQVSAFKLHTRNTRDNFADVDVVFEDPLFGSPPLGHLSGFLDPTLVYPLNASQLVRFPVRFDELEMRNKTDLWGVELMRIGRLKRLHNGGNFELSVGARYFNLREDFSVQGRGGILDDSFWDTKANNNIVGPQVAIHWFRQTGRWKLSTQGSFLAGLNVQNMRQIVSLGTNLVPGTPGGPLVTGPIWATHRQHDEEFSPLVELRAEVAYQITQAFSVKAGWNGMWVNNIARPANMIDYTLPTMGILESGNRQDVFVQGLNVGFEVNR